MDALQVARKHEPPKTSVGVVRLRDNADFIEDQRRSVIWRRKVILSHKGIEPWDFPKDWCDDLKAKDWIPPTPEQVAEQNEIIQQLKKKGRPIKHVQVPTTPLVE